MRIPEKKVEQFVREVTDQCLYSRESRISNYRIYKNYYEHGSDDPASPALYNKTYAYMDDLTSLLYSPVALKYHLADPKTPSIVNTAKCSAAAVKLRSLVKESDTDSLCSEATEWSLVKGKSFIKQAYKGGSFNPVLVQPEYMGVLRESHRKLDPDMEAFSHTMMITPYEFRRMIAGRPDEDELLKKSKKYQQKANPMMDASGKGNVVAGAMYPFQPYQGSPSTSQGVVNWMSGQPMIHPSQAENLMQLDETWVWDDKRGDWTTFHLIGDDMLITGKNRHINLLAYDQTTGKENPILKQHNPFVEFCPNATADYFWGRSEIINVFALQEAINSRITGINGLLRLQEKPPKRFQGVAGVSQNVLSRLSRPGGYFSDASPNAKVDEMVPEIPSDLWASLHEYERMFDDMGGLPPIARGHGEQGVRSGSHADTLVRMFSPRFKDRALLVERSVASLGGLMLDMSRAHVADTLVAWCERAAAGVEAAPENPLFQPPAPGMAMVEYTFADMPDDISVSVDSHSSSPAFAMDAEKLIFNLFKIQAIDQKDVLEKVDIADPEELVAGFERRQIAKAHAEAQAAEAKMAAKAKK